MDDALKIVLLAILQGVTEFLPVSSSGHLVLGKTLLGLATPEGALLEVVLHAGSLVSIGVYYRRRLTALAAGLFRREPEALRYAGWVAASCLPAVLVFGFWGDAVESLFGRPRVVAGLLCLTGLGVLSLRWVPVGGRPVGWPAALAMGAAQALALLPGISRSGATIAAGRWHGLDAAQVSERSFLMVLPLLGGAVLLKASDVAGGAGLGGLSPGGLAMGLAVSALTGYVCLALLVRLLRSTRLYWFGVYCLLAGLAGLFLAG